MLFTSQGWFVLGKLCLKSWASDGTQDRGHSFSQYRPTLAGE